MKEPEKLIVFERTDYPNDMHIKTISLHNNNMPYKEISVKNPHIQQEYDHLNKIFQFGNCVDYFEENGTWRLDHEYRHPSHGYDIVVVLGIYDNSKIIVYGNKTPKTTIKVDPVVAEYKSIQRGDWLLLQKIYDTPSVIHNINQQQLVFEMKQFDQKTR